MKKDDNDLNHFKDLTWKLVLPLTLVSFALFTKWWYVAVDGPNSEMHGFPLPFVCEGWHTSMSLQFFLFEFLVDLVFYFLVWTGIIYLTNRFLIKIKIHKIVLIILLSFSGIVILGGAFVASRSENIFKIRKTFDTEVIDSQFLFLWEEAPKEQE